MVWSWSAVSATTGGPEFVDVDVESAGDGDGAVASSPRLQPVSTRAAVTHSVMIVAASAAVLAPNTRFML
jgi:hypothetical protein